MSASIRSERKQEVKSIEQFMLFLHLLPSLNLAMFVSGIYFLLVLKCTDLAKMIQTYTLKPVQRILQFADQYATFLSLNICRCILVPSTSL